VSEVSLSQKEVEEDLRPNVPITLPVEYEIKAKEYLSRYPHVKSAVMPCLFLAQEHFGYITEGAILWVADKTKLPPVHVMEVATFYTMYYKRPVGRFHVQVCRTLSCALRGANELTKFLETKLQLKPNEVSKDGMWSYEEVECLGSCGTAPMCQLNGRFFENLDVSSLERIMNDVSRSSPPLRFSSLNENLGEGMSEKYPPSISR
jgi:NADH-quinone oxidoreductase subunit E